MVRICCLMVLLNLLSCRTTHSGSSILANEGAREFSCKVVKLVDDGFFDEGLEQFPDGDEDKSSVVLKTVANSPKLVIGGFAFPRSNGAVNVKASQTDTIADATDSAFNSFFFVHDSSSGKAFLMSGNSGAADSATEIAWLNCHHHQGIDPFAGGSGIGGANSTRNASGLKCKFSTSGGGNFTIKGLDGGMFDSNVYRRDGIVQRRTPRIKYDVTRVENNSRSIHLSAKVAPGQTLNTNPTGDTVDFGKIVIKIDKSSPTISTATFKVGGSEFNPMGFDCSDSNFDTIQ
jgi:hypothetical protein